MSKPNMSKIVKSIKTGLSKHNPEILTGLGITGMITTTVLAVRATPKALLLIDNKKEELDVDELSVIETVKTTWKCYIPAAVTGTVSAACLIGASSVHCKRNAALATAYSLSRSALAEYRDKVVETISEKKENAIREKVSLEKIEKNPLSKNEIIITEKGDTLCYDSVSGRYFKSDIETIKRAINEVNRTMTYDNYISLSEFYDEIGLSHTYVSDELGWNLDDGLLDINFGSHIAEDGTPCLVLDYMVAPKYNFNKFM